MLPDYGRTAFGGGTNDYRAGAESSGKRIDAAASDPFDLACFVRPTMHEVTGVDMSGMR